MALKEGYVPADAMVTRFRTEVGNGGSIGTEVFSHVLTVEGGEQILVNTVKATISVEGKVIATGHAQSAGGEEKELEKSEKAAIRRALINFGYAGIDPDFEEAAAETEAEEEAPRTRGKIGRPASTSKAAAPADPEEGPSEEEEEETQEATQDETPAAKTEVKSTAKASTNYSDIMSKYGTKKTTTSNGALAGLRR
jgi:hypothetical protein